MKWPLVAIIVLSTTAADLLKSMGMREHGELRDFRPCALGKTIVAIIQNRFVLAALLADTVSFVAFVALLSVADLSFAVPATAGIFVLDTIGAKSLLNENITWRRWIGASFIACGIGLLAC